MTEREIFAAALEMQSPAERAALLDQACAGDAPRRAHLEGLLRESEQLSSFFDHPPAAIAVEPSPTVDRAPAELPGAHIGPYKLLEQIGEGGMGVVYVAEQTEPVRRRVALKIIKPGMDTKQVIARFEAERQALAMMDHPNIAKIFDAGTVGQSTKSQASSIKQIRSTKSKAPNEPGPPVSDIGPSDLEIVCDLELGHCDLTAGRPFFVMELVRGLPITDHCDKAKLNPRERLALFADVCQAVQHAHQKGVIHRDLKPSNVLVTVHDSRPIAKVIDFGVAKAIGGLSLATSTSHQHSVYTAFNQLVGTPLYMSPEQADLSSSDVDTRSDVYSLGVLLYELLTGTTPFDKERLKDAGFDEMRRIIREEEPETVSARLARTRRVASAVKNPLPWGEGGPPPGGPGEGAQQSTSPATNHQPPATRLSELDWIVMKALEKDRTRRYESASALAADIQRYLSDEPVLACPPTTMYRFQKFARKHKPALITAAAVALCLLLGTTVSAWQAVRATTAEAKAEANEQQANANAEQAKEKAIEATAQRDEAQKQRDEVKALADKLAAKEEQLEQTLYADHIHMAKTAWDSGDVRAMSMLLAQHVPKEQELDRRGFEWRYLNRLSNIGALLSLRTTPWGPSRLALSPNRTRLLEFIPANAEYRDRAKRAGPPTLEAWNLQSGLREFAVELSGVPDRDANGQRAEPKFTPDGAYFMINGSRWDYKTGSYVPGELKVWDTRTGKEIFKTTSAIADVCFSPDNKLLAIPTENQSMKVWDLQAGQERLTLQGQLKLPSAVVFSPDGKRLAAANSTWDNSKKAGVDDEIKIWDVQTGEQLKSFPGHADSIDHLVFSPDGQRLVATAEENDSIKLWDIQTGNVLLTFAWDVNWIDKLHFNADGTRLIALGYKVNGQKGVGYVKLWNAETGQELLSARADELQISPDGKRLAMSDGDNSRTRVFDVQSGQIMLSVKDAGGEMAFSPDSKRLVTQSGGMRIWDLQTGDEINHIKGFDPNYHLAFSLDGKRLIGSAWGKTEVWEVDVEQESAKKILLQGVNRPNLLNAECPAVINSDFSRIAGIAGKSIKLFDAQTGQELRTLTGHDQNVLCVAFSQDGKRIASCDGRLGPTAAAGTVKVWDTESGKELFTVADLAHRMLRLKFSPDGKNLAGTPADSTITVWDATSGRELYSRGTRSPGFTDSMITGPSTFAFSPDGKRLAWGGTIWDAATGDRPVRLKNAANTPRGGINIAAFSSDGKRVAGATIVGSPVGGGTPPPHTNGVWDAETGELLVTTSEIEAMVLTTPLTFSPDGKRLTGGGKIWDAHTGQFLLSLGSEHTGQVTFSQDGHRLAVVGRFSNEVTIYDATPLAEKP